MVNQANIQVWSSATNQISLSQSDVLGAGGEGAVYDVRSHADLVAKIYHPNRRTSEVIDKLDVMINYPPLTEDAQTGHLFVAWPRHLLYDTASNVIGFLMPKVDKTHSLFEYYNPALRRRHAPQIHYANLCSVAKSLATALDRLHGAGYVVGDINESNAYITENEHVTLIDSDSFQVTDYQSAPPTIYRCVVGKAEYTPPELQGVSFADVDRNIHHDRFALAVIIYHLLMEGTHPFRGVYTGAGDPPGIETYISRGYFLHSASRRAPLRPTPTAVEWDTLHEDIRALFRKCFDDGHSNPQARPSPREWVDALDGAMRSLQQCNRNRSHWYFDRQASGSAACTWCNRVANTGIESFPSHPGAQTFIPPTQTTQQPMPSPQTSQRQPTATQQPVSWRQARPVSVSQLSPPASSQPMPAPPQSTPAPTPWGRETFLGLLVILVGVVLAGALLYFIATTAIGFVGNLFSGGEPPVAPIVILEPTETPTPPTPVPAETSTPTDAASSTSVPLNTSAAAVAAAGVPANTPISALDIVPDNASHLDLYDLSEIFSAGNLPQGFADEVAASYQACLSDIGVSIRDAHSLAHAHVPDGALTIVAGGFSRNDVADRLNALGFASVEYQAVELWTSAQACIVDPTYQHYVDAVTVLPNGEDGYIVIGDESTVKATIEAVNEGSGALAQNDSSGVKQAMDNAGQGVRVWAGDNCLGIGCSGFALAWSVSEENDALDVKYVGVYSRDKDIYERPSEQLAEWGLVEMEAWMSETYKVLKMNVKQDKELAIIDATVSYVPLISTDIPALNLVPADANHVDLYALSEIFSAENLPQGFVDEVIAPYQACLKDIGVSIHDAHSLAHARVPEGTLTIVTGEFSRGDVTDRLEALGFVATERNDIEMWAYAQACIDDPAYEHHVDAVAVLTNGEHGYIAIGDEPTVKATLEAVNRGSGTLTQNDSSGVKRALDNAGQGVKVWAGDNCFGSCSGSAMAWSASDGNDALDVKYVGVYSSDKDIYERPSEQLAEWGLVEMEAWMSETYKVLKMNVKQDKELAIIDATVSYVAP